MKARLTKSLAILLTAAMLLCAAPLAGFVGIDLPNLTATAAETIASGTCGADGDNLTWVLDDTGTLTISGTGEMKTFYNPWNSYSQQITTVVIDAGVTSIGSSAFSNTAYYNNDVNWTDKVLYIMSTE